MFQAEAEITNLTDTDVAIVPEAAWVTVFFSKEGAEPKETYELNLEIFRIVNNGTMSWSGRLQRGKSMRCQFYGEKTVTPKDQDMKEVSRNLRIPFTGWPRGQMTFRLRCAGRAIFFTTDMFGNGK